MNIPSSWKMRLLRRVTRFIFPEGCCTMWACSPARLLKEPRLAGTSPNRAPAAASMRTKV
jgi:hypothetical protein